MKPSIGSAGDVSHPSPVVRDLFGSGEAANSSSDATEQPLDEVEAPAIGRVVKRLLGSREAILDREPDQIGYQHTVLCQTSLPYRPTDARVWEREQGNVSLSVEAGRAWHPPTRKWVEMPLPHGEKPRLVLIHMNGEALRGGGPVIDVGDSMTAFVRTLGIDTNGRNLRTLKDQLGRLAAATIRLAVSEDGRDMQINTHIVSAFDLWFPKDENQRVLWPTTVRLSDEYFNSLTRHAVPLDNRAVGALSGSALCLDIYCWLAQRLHRVSAHRPQVITWVALKGQFGVEYGRLDNFRTKFAPALRAVLTVYPEAKVEIADVGLVLWNSPPPVSRRLIQGARVAPLIEGEAVRVGPPTGEKSGG